MTSARRGGHHCIEPAHLRIWPPLGREDLPGLYARTCALLRDGPVLLVCEVGGVAPDAVAADALAQLKLAAARAGVPVRFRGASPELLALLGLMGLRATLNV